MEFTETAIKQAMREETTTGDFKTLLVKLESAGVKKYFYNVRNGLYIFTNHEGEDLFVEGKPVLVNSPLNADEPQARRVLMKAKAGQYDFETFCKRIGETGVASWLVDVKNKEIGYLDEVGQIVVHEEI